MTVSKVRREVSDGSAAVTASSPSVGVRPVVPPAVHPDAKVRREVSQGSASPIVSSPGFTAPPADALCPNCLTEVDEFRFCAGCGKVVRA